MIPSGTVGELCIRGPLVMDGYRNRPDETAKTLRDGWLRTGDLAMRDADGYIYLVGRAKDLIISGGFNVYPAEVEIPIMSHPDVAECAVVGLPHDIWGKAVTAFVVPHPSATIDPDEITELVRAQNRVRAKSASPGLTCGYGAQRPESGLLNHGCAFYLHVERSAPAQVRAIWWSVWRNGRPRVDTGWQPLDAAFVQVNPLSDDFARALEHRRVRC